MRITRPFLRCWVAFLLFPSALYASAPDFHSTSKYMTGDWGGLRTDLESKGYKFTLDYDSIVDSNISGGYNRDKTVRYSDQYTIGADFNLEKIIGITDGEFKMSLVDRNGRDLTKDRIQNPKAPVIGSTVNSNYGRGQTWHVAQFWYRQSWLNNRFDIKLGLMPVGEDFDNNGCYFQNLSLCGSLAGHGAGVWFNTPIGQWGTRIRYNVTPWMYIQTGAFMYNPNYATRHGSFQLDNTGRTGSMYLAELGFTPKFGQQKLPGILKIGFWRNTADANDVLNDSDGNYYVVSKHSPRIHSNRYGGWLYLQQQVTASHDNVRRGLSIFWHLAMNDRNTATMDYQTQLGGIYKGPFMQRPQDTIGFGVSKMHINSKVAKRGRLQNEQNGLDNSDNPSWTPVRSAEYAAELNYTLGVTPWFILRPNVQLLIHPGGDKEIKNSWVLGSRIILHF